MKKNYLYIYLDLCHGELMSQPFCIFKENLISDEEFCKLYNLDNNYDYDLLIFDLINGVRLK